MRQSSVLFVTIGIFSKGFRFPPAGCCGCHGVLMISVDINNIDIINVHGVDYHCIIFGISKNEVIYICINR